MDIDNFDQYLVREGSKIQLSQINAYPRDDIPEREASIEELHYLQKKLIELQEKFFIDRRKYYHRPQGMDTSGKNSTVRNVFRGFNPPICTCSKL